ncbi:hypothetical protein [Cupriavidus pauculus]|uniref:Uncharacterized protein n=1 Tax=Cupriavidus pauculus TaxID=82633 RepID=A0A2N5CDA5_9BURK|nr:hypothetical protein [Cupriavidus pauculus]PLQ00241.1 hypothetical protein CYJ10_11295 [Cupriavidus pauculus]
MTDIEHDDLFRRVGYYDFRAYTQRTSNGLNQGFVLVLHHMMLGTVQSVFRAGKPQAQSAIALAMALEKLQHLVAIAAEDDLPLGSGEQSI